MWMRVDDGLHNHRKTRNVTKSHTTKSRDAAPMGLWILAGSWAAQNGTDGWVPEDELDRWDSDWKPLVKRLAQAGYWWPHQRDGEPGYGFNDWHDYNDPAGAASKAGSFGNHVRWHVNEGKVIPECDHCPNEPTDPEIPESIGGRSGGDIAPDSGGESHFTSGAIALPEPEPLPEPDPNPEPLLFDKSNETDITTLDRFDEFWDTYGKKVDRKGAEQKWRLAIKKPGVTPDMLIAAAHAYVTWERENNQNGRFIMGPTKWLLNERWTDERVNLAQPKTRIQEHLSLVEQLAFEEAEAERNAPRQIGGNHA